MAVRRKAASAHLVLLVVLLAGCARPSTQASSLPRLAASPSSAATGPSDATDLTPAGAAAFARHFYAQITQAYATADPSLLATLSQPSCTSCARFLATLTAERAEHQRIAPAVFTVRFAEAPASDGPTTRVEVQYDYSGATIYSSSGAVLYEEKPAPRQTATLKLILVHGGWRVAEIL